jgi:hypothetical protein
MEALMTKAERKVELIKERMTEIGPLLPGSLSEQWNVCGTPGCRCKNPGKPVKHGPYYQLSFTIGGKSSTMFIKKDEVPEARRRIQRYRRFKALTTELVQAYLALTRERGLSGRAS